MIFEVYYKIYQKDDYRVNKITCCFDSMNELIKRFGENLIFAKEIVGIDDVAVSIGLLSLALPLVCIGVEVRNNIPTYGILVDTVYTNKLAAYFRSKVVAAYCKCIDFGRLCHLDSLGVNS